MWDRCVATRPKWSVPRRSLKSAGIGYALALLAPVILIIRKNQGGRHCRQPQAQHRDLPVLGIRGRAQADHTGTCRTTMKAEVRIPMALIMA